MKANNLTTNLFNFITLLECQIHKQVNMHFTAVVVGYITEQDENEILRRPLNSDFHIYAHSEEGDKYSIFRGFIQDIKIHSEGGLKKLTVRAMSNTGMLENGRHLRTFQDEKQTWKDLVEVIRLSHENTQVIYNIDKNVMTDGLIVQYKESDWEFLKRLASENKTVIVPDCTNDFICFFFGIPVKRSIAEYALDDYSTKRYKTVDNKEQIEYLISSRDNVELCEVFTILGEQYFIYEIWGELKENEFVYNFSLRKSNGFETLPVGNKRITGASIMGRVLMVKDELVRVKLFSDEDYGSAKRLWFPFATVYSSPDGTGWYCMPEEGDQIRVYFPDEQENHAYVISAVHHEDTRGLRKNPDEKFIRTKYDKEVRFSSDRILITNHKGLSVILDDESGIKIKSNKEIHIMGDTSVQIESGETVEIEGKQGVYIRENQNILMVRNGIKEQAMQIEYR